MNAHTNLVARLQEKQGIRPLRQFAQMLGFNHTVLWRFYHHGHIGSRALGVIQLLYPDLAPAITAYTAQRGNDHLAADPFDQFKATLVAGLHARGWQVEIEAIVEVGKIDLLARRGVDTMVIEIKRTSNHQAATQAMAQLLSYSYYYPTATLVFAAPTRPTEEVVKILNHYGVSYYEPITKA